MSPMTNVLTSPTQEGVLASPPMQKPTNRKPYTKPSIRDLGRMDEVTKTSAKGTHGWDPSALDHTKHP